MYRTVLNSLRNCVIGRDYSSAYNCSAISDVYSRNQTNEKVTVKGWIKALRKLKENVFIDVNDGSCNERLQIIIPATQKPPNLATGASIVASGSLNITPRGQLELVANKLEITGECVVADGYPFAPRKSYPPEYIRQYLHLRSRTRKFASVLRVRNAATKAVHDYFTSEGYFNIHTPILTSNDCEGAGEVFSVRPESKSLLKDMLKEGVNADDAYFDSKVYLTVSGQLHLEAMAHGLGKVYTFGPTFRAENSRSRLHLSEFYMIEAESAFTSDLTDVMDVIEKLVKYVTISVTNKCMDDIACVTESATGNLSWLDKPFVTLTYDEALNIIDKNLDKLSSAVNKDEGLTKEHEIFLVNYCGGVPTFVINWPKQMKPFYMKQCMDDVSKVAALDLLAPNVGEIVGGSLRENDYNVLKNNLPSIKSDLDWYLELRKFGSVPTGGFGMGFERYLQFILQVNNIKDTIPFPRWPHNCML